MAELNQQLDDKLREIADKFGTPENKGQLLTALKGLKDDITSKILHEVEEATLSIRSKLQ